MWYKPNSKVLPDFRGIKIQEHKYTNNKKIQ